MPVTTALLVDSKVPSPSVSNAPPSQTKSEPKDSIGSVLDRGSKCHFPLESRPLQIRFDALASSSWGWYLFPHALNIHRTAPSFFDFGLTKKVGP